MEESPKEIYEKYRPEGTVGIDLAYAGYCANSEWDDASSYRTLRGSGEFRFKVTGTLPDVAYRAALMGTTVEGEAFICHFSISNLYASHTMGESIAEKSGIYPNLTLAVAAGGKVTTRTFTCEVQTDHEREEGVALVGSPDYMETPRFCLVSGENLYLARRLAEEPSELQYACTLYDGAVFSGFEGCLLTVPVFFSTGYAEKEVLLTLTLKDDRTGEKVAERVWDMQGIEPGYMRWELDKIQDFEPGEYTLEISVNEQQSTHRIVPEKEIDPFAALRNE